MKSKFLTHILQPLAACAGRRRTTLSASATLGILLSWAPLAAADTPPPPRIESFGRIGSQFRLTIRSQLGLTNAIEIAPDLSGAAWVPLTNLLVTKEAYSVFDPSLPVGGHRFYRVRAWYPEGYPTNAAYIPAGFFTMGSVSWPPIHSVFVSSFYLDKTEVTKTLWDQVRVWALAHGYQFDNAGSSAELAGYPVFKINWHDALKWCNARSEREGRLPAYYTDAAQTNVLRTGWMTNASASFVNWHAGYRLPTEAEWERACRGGIDGRNYPWGNSINCGNASYNLCSRCASAYFPSMCPVGTFAPNTYGLYDVIGNVWEWCWDYYSDTYLGSSPPVDPRGPATGTDHALRGGAWDNSFYDCMCASRYPAAPTDITWNIGFRTAVGAAP